MNTVSRSSRCLLRRQLCAASAFAVLLLAGATLHAAPPAKKPKAAAQKKPASSTSVQAPSTTQPNANERTREEELAKRFDEADQAGDWKESVRVLHALQANDAMATINTLCRLGFEARGVGSYVEAAESLTRCMTVLGLVPLDPKHAEWMAGMDAEMAIARSAVAIVTLTTAQGATVTVDGRALGTIDAGREIFLEPGWHTFAATTGPVTIRETTNLARGQTRVLRLVPAPPKEVPKEPRSTKLRDVGWALTGTGVVAGALFFTGFVINSDIASNALSKRIESGEGCAHKMTPSFLYCTKYASTKPLADMFASASIVSFVAAGALAVGTTIYTVRGSRSAPRATVGLGSVGVVVPF